ncbi:MAG: regulatory protein RecX [FCB group bacterium]|nr:regulatory protein RecX [FCB group bacterium]
MAKNPRKRPSLREKAVDLLSRRRLSRGELRLKLLSRKYDPAEIEDLLDRYEEVGYLDDETLARDYAESRLIMKPMGRRLLELELRKRLLSDGLAESAAEHAFSDISEDDLAEQVVRKAVSLTKDRKKIYQKLARLGFQYDAIESAMSKCEPEAGWE